MAGAPRRVLITNDDGPPNADDSPFIAAFVRVLDTELQWPRAVCLPARQQSWIGKAHRTQDIVRRRVHANGDSAGAGRWTLLETTPAGCVNIALHHELRDPPVDLVISGPNYGRNTGNIFATASGTIGAALEAALCGVRAVAVSFAYSRDRPHTPADLDTACRVALRVVDELWRRWPAKVELFTVNVPLHSNMPEHPRVLSTPFNRARGSSLYVVRPAQDDDGDGNADAYVFRPDYASMLSETPMPGSDAWAIRNNIVSVTAMRAAWAEDLGAAQTVFPAAHPIHDVVFDEFPSPLPPAEPAKPAESEPVRPS
eukprot:Unigene7632_Nuclearia_a/m.23457 Unigene7632_Nuclearia_a/g.23457  ORF Unigene7632_Nuclearia_a/g.23457 Unigene7632_Nuclearia_a/m.23457 type:complete len:313 (-) Unigene7632_Nuclearia_a:50-988(-)